MSFAVEDFSVDALVTEVSVLVDATLFFTVSDGGKVLVEVEGGGSFSEMGSIADEEIVEIGVNVGGVTKGDADSGVGWLGTRLP